MSQAPDMATFQRLVGTPFRLRLDDERRVEVELVEFRQGGSFPHQEQFSLAFRAPADAPPEQRIYELEHEAIGSFEVFLVPVGRTEDGILFEAVFNRQVEPSAGGD